RDGWVLSQCQGHIRQFSHCNHEERLVVRCAGSLDDEIHCFLAVEVSAVNGRLDVAKSAISTFQQFYSVRNTAQLHHAVGFTRLLLHRSAPTRRVYRNALNGEYVTTQ